MPDENAFLTFVIQLLMNFRIHTLIGNTSKNFQMAYFSLSSMSTFIWCHILNIFCWPSNIEEKNRSCYCSYPKKIWKIFRFERAHCYLNKSPFLSLHNTILIGCVSCCEMPANFTFHTKRSEFSRKKLSPSIVCRVFIKSPLSFSTLALKFRNLKEVSYFSLKK